MTEAAAAAAAAGGTSTTPQLQSPGSPSSTLSEDERRKIIEEESKQLERYEKVGRWPRGGSALLTCTVMFEIAVSVKLETFCQGRYYFISCKSLT